MEFNFMNIAAKEEMSPHLLATFFTTGKIYLACKKAIHDYQKQQCNLSQLLLNIGKEDFVYFH